MLLEFKFNNFKNFSEEGGFSMLPAPKLRQLQYSVLTKKIYGKEVKALCSSVIYGANAAGKTNVIAALEVLKGIVLSGSIRNKEINTTNATVNYLELATNINKRSKNTIPVTLSVKAVNEEVEFAYAVTFVAESIINQDIDRSIVAEKLDINGNTVFRRTENKVQYLGNVPKKYTNTKKDLTAFDDLALKADRLELFLTGNFKAFYSSELVRIITEWFARKLIIVYDAEQAAFIPNFMANKKSVSIEEINKVAKELGSTANGLVYRNKGSESETELCSVLINKAGKAQLVPANLYESLGTRRIVDLFPMLALALNKGVTVLIDEFDASIHPMAIISIINAFHNDEINKNKAQLIFNTHNPIYLNSQLFRSDEIKFVDRDDLTHDSEIYALSDFGTKGNNRAKYTNNYMKNYFISKYGAIRDVDFSAIFAAVTQEKR